MTRPFLPEQGFDYWTDPGTPSAGDNLTFAVGSDGFRGQLLGMRFTLTTSASVADRRMGLLVFRGNELLFASFAALVQPASQAWTYLIAPGNSESSVAVGGRVNMRLPFPIEFWSSGQTGTNEGWSFATAVENIDAADEITGALVYARMARSA